MLMTIDEDEKCTVTNSNSGGKTTFLSEDCLYEVLMQSRKPIDKDFKKQVKGVLKSVRQNVMYATDTLLDDSDLFLKTVTKLTVERKARLQA